MTKHRRLCLWGGLAVLATMGALPTRADEKADALLKQVEQSTKAVKTLTADLSLSQSAKGSGGTDQTMKMTAAVKLKKPNLARIDFTEGRFAKTIASDGKSLYILIPGNQYQKMDADPQGRNISVLWAFPVSMFFSGQFTGFGDSAKTKTAYMGKQTVGGTEYDTVQLSGKEPFTYTAKLYISPAKLVTRIDMEITQGDQSTKLDAVLNNVKVDTPLADASFAYAPPKEATLYKPPSIDDYNKKLLAIGSVAPKFTVSTPTGGKIVLDEVLDGKKAVLVNFWFYG